MKSKLSMALLGMTCLLFIRLAIAQDQHHHSPDGTHDDHSMSGMEMPNDSSSSSPTGEQELNAATRLMTSHHMDMGPHMKMTELRKPQPGDQERAKLVVEQARRVMEKYQDYHAALNDGFKIFLPNVPQHQYHFTNYWYGFEAGFRFNPEHPTSLLYEQDGPVVTLLLNRPEALHAINARMREELPRAWEAIKSDANSKRGRRAQSLAWPVRFPRAKPAKKPGASSCRYSSAGWCTCIPMTRMSGRWVCTEAMGVH